MKFIELHSNPAEPIWFVAENICTIVVERLYEGEAPMSCVLMSDGEPWRVIETPAQILAQIAARRDL